MAGRGSTTASVDRQYTNGLSRHNIEAALVAAGKDLAHLEPADLGAIEEFHTMGRIATIQLAELAQVSSSDEVLDAGSGIGGTARFLAHEFSCHVTAIDLTEEYCETARWLNDLVGLADRISVYQGDVTQLPVADATFDVVMSQHVQMNVADKARLYEEARRVLRPSGRLAIWDVTAGNQGQLDYPLPWSDTVEISYLVTPEELQRTIEGAGFTIDHWSDVTDDAAALMNALLAAPPNPLGIHAFVDNFIEKATNLTRGLSDGRLRVIQGIARVPD